MFFYKSNLVFSLPVVSVLFDVKIMQIFLNYLFALL